MNKINGILNGEITENATRAISVICLAQLNHIHNLLGHQLVYPTLSVKVTLTKFRKCCTNLPPSKYFPTPNKLPVYSNLDIDT